MSVAFVVPHIARIALLPYSFPPTLQASLSIGREATFLFASRIDPT